jgi:hypothetical protein
MLASLFSVSIELSGRTRQKTRILPGQNAKHFNTNNENEHAELMKRTLELLDLIEQIATKLQFSTIIAHQFVVLNGAEFCSLDNVMRQRAQYRSK